MYHFTALNIFFYWIVHIWMKNCFFRRFNVLTQFQLFCWFHCQNPIVSISWGLQFFFPSKWVLYYHVPNMLLGWAFIISMIKDFKIFWSLARFSCSVNICNDLFFRLTIDRQFSNNYNFYDFNIFGLSICSRINKR